MAETTTTLVKALDMNQTTKECGDVIVVLQLMTNVTFYTSYGLC